MSGRSAPRSARGWVRRALLRATLAGSAGALVAALVGSPSTLQFAAAIGLGVALSSALATLLEWRWPLPPTRRARRWRGAAVWAICTASFWLGLLNSSYMKTLVTTGSPSEAVAAPFAELASASYPLSLLLLGWTGYCGILACPFPLVTRGADAPLLDLEDLEAIAFPTAASVAAMGVAFGGFGVIVAALMVVIAGLELAALTALFRLADGLIDRLQPDDDPP